MKIKLGKDLNDLKAGAIIDIEEKEMDAYLKEGHILYTEDVVKIESQTAIKAFRDNVKEEIIMTDTKEIKKEITTPNIIVKSEKNIEGLQGLCKKLFTGEVKSFEGLNGFSAKANAGMNESDNSGADGGYLLTHEIYDQILGRLFEGGKVYPDVKKIQVGPNYNGMKLPYLNITTQSATSQPRLYRLAEGAQKTPTKFTFGQHDLSLTKLIALVPITEELLQDKTTLESYVFSQLKGQFGWRLDYDVLYGTAASSGHIGVLDATASAFQVQNVAHGANVTIAQVNAIIAGVAPQVRDGAKFYCSGDMWANIMANLGPGIASLLVPVASENGGARKLMGYDVVIVDGMTAHNTAKDLLFMNPKEVAVIEKGGLMIDISKEFYFDTDQIALRFVQRTAGAPVFATYSAVDGKSYGAISTDS